MKNSGGIGLLGSVAGSGVVVEGGVWWRGDGQGG